jgi:hypothetical protein
VGEVTLAGSSLWIVSTSGMAIKPLGVIFTQHYLKEN